MIRQKTLPLHAFQQALSGLIFITQCGERSDKSSFKGQST